MRTLKRILGVLLIFFFGCFVGAAVTSAGAMQKLRETLLGGPEAVMDVVVKRLDHELKLDEEQKRKLLSIVDDARIKLRQSRSKIQPEVEETLQEAEQRTRAILSTTGKIAMSATVIKMSIQRFGSKLILYTPLCGVGGITWFQRVN